MQAGPGRLVEAEEAPARVQIEVRVKDCSSSQCALRFLTPLPRSRLPSLSFRQSLQLYQRSSLRRRPLPRRHQLRCPLSQPEQELELAGLALGAQVQEAVVESDQERAPELEAELGREPGADQESTIPQRRLNFFFRLFLLRLRYVAIISPRTSMSTRRELQSSSASIHLLMVDTTENCGMFCNR